ncbi:MAG: general stress protein [Phenylobacterium sp.]|nr:MAG: general stress protein [Phenylobacterium sp.]
MSSPAELKDKLLKALKSDRTVMLRLSGDDGGAAQPMTVQLDKDTGDHQLYIFTAKDSDLVESLGQRQAAQVVFASKGHDLFATIDGELVAVGDPALIDRFWNPFVAAWFEGGQTDPKLQLLRFEPGEAHIWENDNSVFAGVRLLMGRDPKADYKDKTAHLPLS